MDISLHQTKLSGRSELEDEILCPASEVQQDLIAEVEDSFTTSESKTGSSAEQPGLSIETGQINYEDKQEHLRSNAYKFGFSIGQPQLSVQEQACYKNNPKDAMTTTQCKIGLISGLPFSGVKEEKTQSKVSGHFESEAEMLSIANVVLRDLITKVEILCNKRDVDFNAKRPDVTLREGLISSEDNQEYLIRSHEYITDYSFEQPDLCVKEEQIPKENNQEDILNSTEFKIDPVSGQPDLEVKKELAQLKVFGLSESETEKLCKVNEILHHLIKKVEVLCTENDTGTCAAQPVLSKREGQINYEDKRANLTRNNTYIIGCISEQPNLRVKEDQISNYNNQEDFQISNDGKTDPIFGKPDLGVVAEEKVNYGNSQEDFLNSTEYKTGSSGQSELTVKEGEENENSQNSEPLNEDIEDSLNNEEYIDVVGIHSEREPPLETEVR